MDGRRLSAESGVGGAYVKIVEQPASKALRFRYECEGRSAGSIPGVNSTSENKTFPTIQVVGYKGRAVVVVSCVTKDQPYKPHPHNLVGKEGFKKGVCTVEINNENMMVSFANLGIQCVKKKDIEEALKVREEIRVDPFRTGFAHKTQASSIDLNAVRLCFQVFLEGPERGKFTIPLRPVVSETIYDKKAMADLVICKLSHCSGSVAGGTEVILLCEKVAKEDISVRFYEEKDGNIVWEGYGDFTPQQVHKQVAITFRTPSYRTLDINQPVQALIQLRRPSDNATSEALPFQITPLDSDPAMLKRKRHKHNDDVIRQMQESDLRYKSSRFLDHRLSNLRVGFNGLHVQDPLAVKREPETSPNPYMYGAVNNRVSPLYASRTPSPSEYGAAAAAAGPSTIMYQACFSPGVGATGGTATYQYQMPSTSPGLINPQHLQPPQLQQHIPQPHNTPTTDLLDMDTHQYSVELNLNKFDSKDLAELSALDGNLSANLSANLRLNDYNNSNNMNMSDSLTTLATNTINELCGMDLYHNQ